MYYKWSKSKFGGHHAIVFLAYAWNNGYCLDPTEHMMVTYHIHYQGSLHKLQIPKQVYLAANHYYCVAKNFRGSNIHKFRGFRTIRKSFLLEIWVYHITYVRFLHSAKVFSAKWSLLPDPRNFCYMVSTVLLLKILHENNNIA